MVRKKVHWFIVLSLLVFFFVVGNGLRKEQSVAATHNSIFYVAPNGSDTNEGSLLHPWATINHAADVLNAGETVYIRTGKYSLTQQIRAHYSGTENAWITYAAFPGERVVIDAEALPVPAPSGEPPFAHDQGAFQLENVEYIRVKNLEVINSHNSGFTVRNSHHIELYNNKTENTFSPGIRVWRGHDHKIIGNIVINANALEMTGYPLPEDFQEAPHEGISIGSVEQFEVAYNLVHHSQKEGIDIKGVSKHGTMHHNYVHHLPRQGLYVDSWRDTLEDVEVFDNVVHDCRGAGFVLSVEGGVKARDVRVYRNLIYDNWGTGIFFSRWGRDGLRENIKIYNNTVHHNGYGQANPGESFYWIPGGLYLLSNNLQGIEITNNIFSKNTGFQIGYSDRYLRNNSDIEDVFQQQNIRVHRNLIFGINNTSQPIYAGAPPDNYANIYATNGTLSVVGNPQFIDPETGNFYLQPGSPAAELIDSSPDPNPSQATTSQTTFGAFPLGAKPNLWWQANFPPDFSNPLVPNQVLQGYPQWSYPQTGRINLFRRRF